MSAPIPPEDSSIPPSESSSGFGPGVPPVPTNASPEEKDAHWYKYVYQGDKMPQLTLRSVLMGGILGMLMAASNLYTSLAIGWGFGVAITASVMSYVIWNLVRAASGGTVSKMSVLENNCMASTASAAGYSTGSTIATMFGALLLLADPPPGKTSADVSSMSIQPVWVIVLFTLCTGLMGVFLAIPLKKQMINHEQLRFPSGVAAAETLRNLFSEAAGAVRKAYMLIAGIGFGALVGIFNTGEGTLPILDRFFKAIHFRLPESIPDGRGFYQLYGKELPGFGIDVSVLLVAAGVITRLRVCLSMLAGSALLYFVIGPWLVQLDQHHPGTGWVLQNGSWIFDPAAVKENVIRNIDFAGGFTVLKFTTWSLWGGTSLMVFTSLASVALQWKTIARAFTNLRKEGQVHEHIEGMKKVEVPTSWMIAGMVPITIAMIFVQVIGFKIAWWAGVIAVIMAFFLSLVACRATGETDTTPIGAMGKVMQLLFAVLSPGNIHANLAAAGIAANSASSSADLLTDLKSGYLLGANPRRQFLAQFVGVFFGTIAIVPIWFLMVPNRAALEKFAAPSTKAWEAVARVLTKGIDQLPDSAKVAILIGAIVGIALPLIERAVPAKYRQYLPSAMGLGLSWIIPFSNAIGFAIGAVLGKLWELFHRRSSDEYSISLASGLIAGESLIKAVIAMAATAAGLLSK
ncbi:MAG: OPT family oligopeptide transporter [Tepidisphaera sp.]|nr:OPT family oligopeptide transporter [Tepidisphaera sp.]